MHTEREMTDMMGVSVDNTGTSINHTSLQQITTITSDLTSAERSGHFTKVWLLVEEHTHTHTHLHMSIWQISDIREHQHTHTSLNLRQKDQYE